MYTPSLRRKLPRKWLRPKGEERQMLRNRWEIETLYHQKERAMRFFFQKVVHHNNGGQMTRGP